MTKPHVATPLKTPPVLNAVGLTKSYGDFRANDEVSFSIQPGEIHALLGENGAGKSTLVKFIYGVQKADSGIFKWEGQKLEVENPSMARALGIGMVFQHFSLFDCARARMRWWNYYFASNLPEVTLQPTFILYPPSNSSPPSPEIATLYFFDIERLSMYEGIIDGSQ